MKVGEIINYGSSWPAKIKSFVGLYFGQSFDTNSYYFFQEDESDGSGYRFIVSDGATVYFNKDGEWIEVKGNKSVNSNVYTNLLPQEMRYILETKYTGGAGSTSVISRRDNYYMAMFDSKDPAAYNPIWLLYDADAKKEIEAPAQSVMDFLNDYVAKPDENMVLKIVTIVRRQKEFYYHFSGEMNNKLIMNMFTTIDGTMAAFNLAGDEIPRTALDYLPTKVKEFVDKNIPAQDKMMEISNGINDLYSVYFKASGRITFDKDWNVNG